MKSIKPGRGPSMMNAFGSIFSVIFGIIWTIAAMKMGAPFFFPLFGILFICMGVMQAVYNYKNAIGENRFSSFDITENGEERDLLNDYFNKENENLLKENIPAEKSGGSENKFCPYCGKEVGSDFIFCPKCGKQLPKN